MTEIDPGHIYDLGALDGWAYNRLTFVKRQGPNYPWNASAHAGTTLQEVLRACCARLRYVHRQAACEETPQALEHLREAIHLLEVRAARRHGRPVTMSLHEAEFGPTCPKCGHVGCQGGCH